MLRENSYIQDIFGTYVRNEVICQVCTKRLIRYDYAQTFQLAIPKSNMRSIMIMFVKNESYNSNHRNNNMKFPKVYTFTLDKLSKVLQVLMALCVELKKDNISIDVKNLEYFETNFNSFNKSKPHIQLLKFLDRNSYIFNINENNFITVYENANNSNKNNNSDTNNCNLRFILYEVIYFTFSYN